MTLPCEIVKDMLVLYADDALTDESTNAVREHLAACEDCSTFLEKIRKDKVSATEKAEIEAKAREYKKRRKKILRTVICSAVCLFLVFGWWFFTTATTQNPNIFVTTYAYIRLYVFGDNVVKAGDDPLLIYCESRYQLSGTRQKLSDYGFEYSGKMNNYKMDIMIKDGEIYYADIYDNRFIAWAKVVKAENPTSGDMSILQEFQEAQQEESTGE